MKKILLFAFFFISSFSFVQAQWTNNGSNTSFSLSGGVGIGTTTIGSSKLVLDNPTTSNNALRLDRGKFSMGGVSEFDIDAHGVIGGRLKVLLNGNIGIGTNNPGNYKLNVWGSVRAHELVINNPALANALRLERGRFSMGGLSEFQIDADGMVGGRMNVLTNGNIGMGIQEPGDYRLNVWGRVRAHEIVVNTTGADFVFEEGYTFPSLDELERFIKENKHLPEIPSASEMQEEGMSVGDLQTKLLQKIEELTLYMIEMKKENEKIKNELNKLIMNTTGN